MSGALSLALQGVPFPSFELVPSAIVALNFRDTSSLVLDITGTPSISSIKYANNPSLSASASPKNSQPTLTTINGQRAARFDGGDDHLEFAAQLTTIRTVWWVCTVRAPLDTYMDTWLGFRSVEGLYAETLNRLLNHSWGPHWNTTWYLNNVAVDPRNSTAPLNSPFVLAMQTISNASADYISKDRGATDRGIALDLGEFQASSAVFTSTDMSAINKKMMSRWDIS